MPRVIPSLSLIAAAALLLTACTSPLSSRSVKNPDDVNNSSRVYPETLQPHDLALPKEIPFAELPADMSAVSSHAFDTYELELAGWQVKTTMFGMVYLTRSHCSLFLSVTPFPTLAGSLEIDDTTSFLAQYMSTSDWQEILPAFWSVNGGASTLEALTVSGLDVTGAYEIATARVLSGSSRAYLVSLSCDDGVATEKVFVDEVVPNVSIEMT